MPLGTLENIPHGSRLWENVYESARARGFSERRAAMQAWGAVRNAGYYQDSGGTWHAPGNPHNMGEVIDVEAVDRIVEVEHTGTVQHRVGMTVPTVVGLVVGAIAAWATYAYMKPREEPPPDG